MFLSVACRTFVSNSPAYTQIEIGSLERFCRQHHLIQFIVRRALSVNATKADDESPTVFSVSFLFSLLRSSRFFFFQFALLIFSLQLHLLIYFIPIIISFFFHFHSSSFYDYLLFIAKRIRISNHRYFLYSIFQKSIFFIVDHHYFKLFFFFNF